MIVSPKIQPSAMSGPDYAKWVDKAEGMHRELMREAGFLAKP